MKSKSVFLTAIALCFGALSFATPASALVSTPTPRPALESKLAVTPVEFSIGFSITNGRPYYYGHRGYRYQRQGYRYHNGFWFPRSAFIITQDYRPRIYERRVYRQRVVSLPYEHVRWCEYRYRSYRAYDNSFQPNHGRRRACLSPYY
jgi:hypothetical protein